MLKVKKESFPESERSTSKSFSYVCMNSFENVFELNFSNKSSQRNQIENEAFLERSENTTLT